MTTISSPFGAPQLRSPRQSDLIRDVNIGGVTEKLDFHGTLAAYAMLLMEMNNHEAQGMIAEMQRRQSEGTESREISNEIDSLINELGSDTSGKKYVGESIRAFFDKHDIVMSVYADGTKKTMKEWEGRQKKVGESGYVAPGSDDANVKYNAAELRVLKAAAESFTEKASDSRTVDQIKINKKLQEYNGASTLVNTIYSSQGSQLNQSRVFKAGASEALEQAVKSGDKAAVGAIKTRVVSEIGYVVGNEMGKHVGRSLLQSGTRSARRLAKAGFNRMAEQFTQQMVEKMASRAFDKVAKAAAKQAARGKAVTSKGLTKSFSARMNTQGYFAMARGSWSLSHAVRGTFAGANGLGQGVVGMQRAKLQNDARDLSVDMMWLQMLMQMNDGDKKHTAKRMETLVGQQNDIAVSASEQVQKTGEMRIRFAASSGRA